MSRVYDTIEPAVIDEDMLLQCVEEQGPKGEAGNIAKREGINFGDVRHLRLDFKNILKIDNLWQFSGLVKLQLDNNIIEKIEGLDLLVNLEWLDLSFNNIEVIEGLDKLPKLTDLTLYNNRISQIENMDNLKDLHVLSLGNNKINELENVVYLRRFGKLNTLNLNGNPICEAENYKPYVIAHLPNLVYLEYRLIDEAAREAAIEQYKYSLEEIIHDENVARRKQDDERQNYELRQLHKAAYIEDLDGPELFDSMYTEDVDGDKLAMLPGMDDLLISYKEKFVEICKEIASFGLKEHSRREQEKKAFFSSIAEAVDVNRIDAVEKVSGFNDYKRKVLGDLATVADQSIIDKRLKEVSNEIQILWDTLMGFEMQLVDQLEEAIKDFERNMTDMVNTFEEQVQGLMSQCRELEGHHHERVSDIAMVTLEKLMKNELEEDLPDELRMLFVDKDTVTNSVTASHDTHLTRIDNKEDDIRTRAKSTKQSLIEKIHNEEITRNRNRVVEINNLIDHYKEELENFEPGPA